MRRILTTLLLVGLVAAYVPVAEAARPKKPRERTFFVVAGGDGCALSTSRDLGGDTACSHDGLGRETSVLGNTPISMGALDGLPLTLDVARPLVIELKVRSRATIGYEGPLGAGRAQVAAAVTATAGGEDVLVGEATSEPYTVSPGALDYRVRIEIEPDAALSGVALDSLTLGVTVTGPSANHGYFPADGSSTIVVPAR